jgi:hypothetical protein
VSDRDDLAQILDDADDRWQHGIGSGGYDADGPPYWLADAVLSAGWLPPARADAAMRELSDHTKNDALRVSRAMIALGEGGVDLLAALDRDRARETGSHG